MQATLGSGSSKYRIEEHTPVVGNRKPIFLCSKVPNKMETCALNLEEEVIFFVQGPQSIHLSEFFSGEHEEPTGDAYGSDLYGKDISASESDGSSDYDSEEGFGDDSTDDDEDMYPSSPVRTSGVVIEELADDDKPATKKGVSKEGKENKQLSASAKNNSEKQVVLKRCYRREVLEPEDKHGLPLRSNDKIKVDPSSTNEMSTVVKEKSNEETMKKQAKDEDSIGSLKRKVEDVVGEKEEKRESGQQPGPSSSDADMKQMKKKKNKKKRTNNEEAMQLGDEGHQKHSTDWSISIDANSAAEDKKKKRNNKKQAKEAEATTGQAVANKKESSQEISKGESQVDVHYSGKLKNIGEIFDSNIGKAPSKFRLGVGQVIKGWDVGVNGMREGDKRRITISPAMRSYMAKFIVIHAVLLFILFSLVPVSNGVVQERPTIAVHAPKEEKLLNVPYPLKGYNFPVHLWSSHQHKLAPSYDCSVDPPFLGYAVPWDDDGELYCVFFPYSPERLERSIPKSNYIKNERHVTIKASVGGSDHIFGLATAVFVGGFSILGMDKTPRQLNLTGDHFIHNLTIVGATDVEVEWGDHDRLTVELLERQDFGVGGRATYEFKVPSGPRRDVFDDGKARNFTDKVSFIRATTGQREEFTFQFTVHYPYGYYVKRNIYLISIFLGCCIVMCIIVIPLWDQNLPRAHNVPATTVRAKQLAKMRTLWDQNLPRAHNVPATTVRAKQLAKMRKQQ